MRDLNRVSERERQVMYLMSVGLTKRECGDALGLSEDTIKTHLQRLRERLDARNTAHLVAILKDRDLI